MKSTWCPLVLPSLLCCQETAQYKSTDEQSSCPLSPSEFKSFLLEARWVIHITDGHQSLSIWLSGSSTWNSCWRRMLERVLSQFSGICQPSVNSCQGKLQLCLYLMIPLAIANCWNLLVAPLAAIIARSLSARHSNLRLCPISSIWKGLCTDCHCWRTQHQGPRNLLFTMSPVCLLCQHTPSQEYLQAWHLVCSHASHIVVAFHHPHYIAWCQVTHMRGDSNGSCQVSHQGNGLYHPCSWFVVLTLINGGNLLNIRQFQVSIFDLCSCPPPGLKWLPSRDGRRSHSAGIVLEPSYQHHRDTFLFFLGMK